MEKIIDKVDVSLIMDELTDNRILRNTNKGGNVLYVVDAHNAPNTMREIGRLREEAFRAEGASSGLSSDIDCFDTMEDPYRQLIVWDPEAKAIIGGYRFILGTDVRLDKDGQPVLATSHMFHFSEEFINRYLPHTVELGRSFVARDYQSSKAGAKGLFALDNLWDGLGAIMIQHSQVRYFFGKMTIYPSYDRTARDMIYYFLDKHFPDPDKLVMPREPVHIRTDARLLSLILDNDDLREDYRKLKQSVMKMGTNIPPLVNSYINTSPGMKMFGTGKNHEFGEALESAILICFDEIYEEKRVRHVESFKNWMVEQYHKRFPNLEPGFDEKLGRRWKERRLKARKENN